MNVVNNQRIKKLINIFVNKKTNSDEFYIFKIIYKKF